MLTDTEAVTLTSEQTTRLHDLERVVEKNLVSFLEAGRALLAIRDEGLHRLYGTWEQYCRRRFGISESRGLELVRSTEVAQRLLEGPANPDNGDAPLPADLAEDCLRPLHGLEPALQSACWRLATHVGKPTGHLVGQIVRVVQSAIRHGSNGSSERSEPERPQSEAKRAQKAIFLAAVNRLAAGDTFNPQIILLHVTDPAKAYRCATHCRVLISRCEAILAELQRRFPDL